ncbi:helix-turn-helix domain-containing protein [Amycolatopsis sp. NPDC021455]|uniref:VMAP-C domain-containing protein n=1 Tax=Amycolatopsis sp. NPDC021455 TaxID=3154901 RepID=UPI0033E658C9
MAAEETVTELLVDRIKRARSVRGWTAQQLADACVEAGLPALSRGTIAKIESGARKAVTAEEIAVLAHVLDTTPTDLLTTPAWPFGSGGADARLHLLVAVVPDAIDPEQVVVSRWREAEPGDWPARGETRVVPAGEIEWHVADFATAAEAAWAEQPGSLVLEVLLPRTLMHLPVQRWRQEPEVGGGRPLALDYAVHLRSLERMVARRWHRRWWLRWKSLLADPSPDRIYFAGPDDMAAPQRFEAILSDDRWGAVVLPGAPAPGRPEVPDPLLATIRSGVPAVLWHPSASPDSVRELVESLAHADGLADLPRHVRSARQREYGTEAAFARDLVLLWDDPARLVPVGGGPGDPALGQA